MLSEVRNQKPEDRIVSVRIAVDLYLASETFIPCNLTPVKAIRPKVQTQFQ